MIRSFKDAETEKIFNGQRSRKLPPDIQNAARRKLIYLDLAQRLEDLRIPPANQLEALKGDRKGQNSIRINRQWRICFAWRAGHADHVEIVDYHD